MLHASSRQLAVWKSLPQTYAASRANNAIRQITDVDVKGNPEKQLIRLTLGDPTISGYFPPPDVVVHCLKETLMSYRNNGYTQSFGSPEARKAVAKKFTNPQAPLTADDIVLTSGCSHALQLSIESLAQHGDNVLIPNPGFPLYRILTRPLGIEARQYNLNMEKDGSIDLDHLESLIDEKTKAVIINNPGNPTGVVFSKCHLEDILRVADRNCLPIIADEVYGSLVFGGAKFYSIAELSPQVPILRCDGIAKRLMVPGWRLGWIAIHDRHDVFSEVRKGIIQLTQRIIEPNTLVQGALPKILNSLPQSYIDSTTRKLEENAETLCSMLKEESVHILPGTAFNAPGWIRLGTVHPPEVIAESCLRIRSYCFRRLNEIDNIIDKLKKTM